MPQPLKEIETNHLKQLLRKELRQYLSFDEPIDETLGEFRVLRDQLEVQSQPKALFARRLALNTIFKEIVDEIYKEEKELALILRRRFFEKGTIRQVASEFHLGDATVSRRQEEGLERVTAMFQAAEEEAREAWFHRQEVYLPAQPYTKLFGVDPLITSLVKMVEDPKGPPIITLFGIGGIGKSSLADATLRQGLRSGLYNRVAWLYFEQDGQIGSERKSQDRFISLLAQQLMPKSSPLTLQTQMERLRARLKMDPHLIVIDNLENLDETNQLVHFLTGWADPTRFIITTRVQPEQVSGYIQNLTELSEPDALAFLEYLMHSNGLTPHGEADKKLLNQIVEIAGGNPLALKIIVGLLRRLSLDNIVAEMEQGRGNAKWIYNKIYAKSWECLSEPGQLLLQAMPLTGTNSGATPEQMQAASGLPLETFWQAVEELISYSMLEVRGSLTERRYGIHQLTESFINSEIIGLDNAW